MSINIFTEFTEFTIDNISKYLTDNKNVFIEMNLGLDSHEISKSLTGSLNRSIIGIKSKLSDIYDSIANNFDDMTNKVKIIEDNIRDFNSKEKLGYFIDTDNIILLVFYKQFIYIQKLILEINYLINSNINLVYINFYLISKLYDEPNKISSNYIYILKKLINNQNFENDYGSKLKEFLNSNSLDIIFNIIKIIYNLDNDFSKLIDDLKKEKIDEYKKNNITDHSESYEEIEKQFKNISGGNDSEADIFNKIEQKYNQKKNYILLQKRNIDILNIENINLILSESISIELWHGYNLFIYKRFNYDFKAYQSKINEFIKQKQLDEIYLLNLDFLNDLDVPDAGILLPSIIGGSNDRVVSLHNSIFNSKTIGPIKIIDSIELNKSYHSKYIKYKNKYIRLKNNFSNK